MPHPTYSSPSLNICGTAVLSRYTRSTLGPPTPIAPSEADLPTLCPIQRQSRVDDSLGELLASGATSRLTNNIGITTRRIRNANKHTFFEASSSSNHSDPIRFSDDSELSNILPQGVNNRASR